MLLTEEEVKVQKLWEVIVIKYLKKKVKTVHMNPSQSVKQMCQLLSSCGDAVMQQRRQTIQIQTTLFILKEQFSLAVITDRCMPETVSTQVLTDMSINE